MKAEEDYPEINTSYFRYTPNANCYNGETQEYFYENYYPIGYYQASKLATDKYLKFYFSYKSDFSVKEGDLYYDYRYQTEEDIYDDECYPSSYKYDDTQEMFNIQFADGSKHSMEDYFTADNFADMVDAFKKLADDFGFEIE
jgi:hypothetical protein